MPRTHEEARGGGHRQRAPEGYVNAADLLENEPELLDRQAVWLLGRLPLTPQRARLIAELYFGGRS